MGEFSYIIASRIIVTEILRSLHQTLETAQTNGVVCGSSLVPLSESVTVS